MKNAQQQRRLDALVRVSRVGGRSGESFISPQVQRKSIASYADAFGYEIAEWHEELDVSGKTTNRNHLNCALERIEAGASDGIIVSKLDRFARNTAEGLQTIQRITEAGGDFICVEQQLDTTTGQGRFFVTMLLAFAELEREARKEGWAVTTQEAVGRGAYVARAPFGYVKQPNGVLAPDPESAPLVAALFEMRVAGSSWAECHAHLLHLDVRLTREGIKKLIANPAYRGWARCGASINEHAHPPLVADDVWLAAQFVRTKGRRPSSTKSDACLLAGLIRCSSCGYAMQVHGNVKTGISYQCRKAHGQVTCPAPASIRTAIADAHVEALVLEAFHPGGYLAEPCEDTDDLSEAVDRVEAARAELDAYLRAASVVALGEQAFLAGAQERQRMLDLAQMNLAAHQGGASSAGASPANLLDAWSDLSTPLRRRVLAAFIDRVVISPAEKRGQRTGNEKRIQVVLDGNVLLKPEDVPVPTTPRS